MSSINDHSPIGTVHRPKPQLLAVVSLLVIVSLACNLPFSKKSITSPTASVEAPTAEPVDLPPTVVETAPQAGSILSLQGGIELVFDQPMERESVEGAISLEPSTSGRFEWDDEHTVRFIPDRALPADSAIMLTVGESARDKNGQTLLRPMTFTFQTLGDLRIAERFPAADLADVDPGSTVAVTFTQPVVPIGESAAPLPEALTLEPAVPGSGRWLNSSTYLFEPELSLGGGVTYKASVNPAMTSLAGYQLDKNEILTWTFQTAPPRISYEDPPASNIVWLDEDFSIYFNQAMDQSSVEENLLLLDPQGRRVAGAYTWEENNSKVTFTPSELLPRATLFEMVVGREARSYGGTRLGADWRYQYQTVGGFDFSSSDPIPENGIRTFNGYGSITVKFSSPFATGQDLGELVTVSPQPVDLWRSISGEGDTLYISGYFDSTQEYRLSISGRLQDRWGEALGEPYSAAYRVADLEPSLSIPMLYTSDQVIYLPQGETTLPASATNLRSLDIKYTPVSLEEMLSAYKTRWESAIFQAETAWTQTVDLAQNRDQPFEIGLTPDGSALPPGLYRYQVTSPEVTRDYESYTFWVVVSQVQVALKASRDEVFVWATRLEDRSAMAEQPVAVYNSEYKQLGSGVTDVNGIAVIETLPLENPFDNVAVVINEPGDPNYSVAYSFWNEGIEARNFQLSAAPYQTDLKAYFTTDRPIYRPGQTVYFNAILRKPDDARYLPVEMDTLQVELYGEYIPERDSRPLIGRLQLPVSAYGTLHGEFTLPEDAAPGSYNLRVGEEGIYVSSFIVAEYRKPEIDLEVRFDKTEQQPADGLHADIAATYFFGGPANGAQVSWSLYARKDYFPLPEGHIAGLVDTSWLEPEWVFGPPNPLGTFLIGGQGLTDQNGLLTVDFTPEQLKELMPDAELVTLSLEATLVDETGMSLSQRGSVQLHPADFYIGIRRESWGQPAGTRMGFSILTTDWDAQPSGLHTLNATFQKVVWKQDFVSSLTGEIQYTQELTNISGSGFRTDAGGRARLEFTPPEPGTYLLEISGGGAVSQTLIWVGGSGSTAWPRLPNQHIRLDADRQEYKAGDSAEIFIPNPFESGATALVTVERTNVLRSQVLEINASSRVLELELDEGDAPNVFVSVLLIGKGENGRSDFRQGYIQLNVDPVFSELQVDLIPQNDRLEPGATARAEIRVRDSSGNPVQGEFSLMVVDAAIYALAEPNSVDIREAFYGTQLLRVRTGLSLVADAGRIPMLPPAVGGGGGGGFPEVGPVLRSDFRDTAYWNAAIQTGVDGRAEIEFEVPDNLTTWVMTLRGTTRDTKVGETVVNILATKELLVRPITPRFLVAGDRVELGAVVHNNTTQDLEVKVSLLATGVVPEQSGQIEQTIQLKAGARQRVDWWVKVQNSNQADLVFSATGGGYTDATTPPQGALPILRYSAPATFATNGVLAESGQTLEVVSLPRSFKPTGGNLSLEMTSTLAGTVLKGLEAMDDFPLDFSEPVVSRLFANLAVYNLLREADISSPDLATSLQSDIRAGLDHLIRLQNEDGGWGWGAGGVSDLYLSSYALLTLTHAAGAGFNVDEENSDLARRFILSALYPVTSAREDWEIDRLALAKYALNQSGRELLGVDDLHKARERLSPWAKALLALSYGPDDERASVIISDLQSSAVRSATGAFWQDPTRNWFNHSGPAATTALVVYALAERDPASAVLTEAVRYLTLHRRASGCWDSSYDSAWSILALSRVLRATGDLQADFNFSAVVNGVTVASGQAAGLESVLPVNAVVELDELYTDQSNALTFERGSGPGRLYYRAYLQVDAPVEGAQAVEKGVAISRGYTTAGTDCGDQPCPAIDEVELGDLPPVILAQVAVTLPYDMYDLVVEDFIPAGTEIVNTRLQTSQLGMPDSRVESIFPLDIVNDGWGWWYFGDPLVYDDHIRWVAGYVPAGTYILTYRLLPVQPGEFRVLPAHAYAYYFPEVEGRSAGALFTIKE